jgi:hypothetical protein
VSTSYPYPPAAPETPVEAPPRKEAGIVATLVAGGVIAVIVAASGFPLGWLWSQLAPRIPLIKVDGGYVYATEEPEQVFAGDGWFVILGAAAGIVFGVLIWLLAKRWRGVVTLLAATLGALGAAWLAYWFGPHLDLAHLKQLAQQAQINSTVQAPLGLRITSFNTDHPWTPKLNGVLAIQALFTAFTLLCCAGWSKYASLRGPDPEPHYYGYQFGLPAGEAVGHAVGEPAPPVNPVHPGEDQFGPGTTGSADTASGTART